LIYLALLFVAIIGFTILRGNVDANVLWIIFLAIPTLLGGFFLKRWMPCVFGVLDCGIVTVAWLFPQRFPWAGLNHIPIDFLSDIYILLLSIALIASLYAWSVERAVRQADRAEELEQLITRFKETNEELHALQGDLLENNIALKEANTRLASLATTDPLTDLPNHRALSEIIDEIWEQQRHMPHAFALLFFDIDHFKMINDTLGHKSGDDVLRAFARILHQTLRDNDVVGRWGGEEFVAVLPDIDEAHAIEIAERVRHTVDTTIFSVGQGIHLTCSIGVACCQQNSHNQQDILDAADRAMYEAKHTGRNRVCTATKAVIPFAA
jgi:diguanylate cyclase (GGDEF)-like protein